MSLDPANPYAAPEALLVAPRPAHRVPSAWFYAFVAMEAIRFAAWGLRLVMLPRLLEWSTEVTERGAWLLWLSTGLVWVGWARAFWQRLPKRDRVIGFQSMTPNQVALRCLIPYYNFYWRFVLNRAVCHRIDVVRTRRGLSHAAPLTLAIVCPIGTVIYYTLSRFFTLLAPCWFILSLAADLLWIIYMLRAERALAEAHLAKSSRKGSS